MSSKGEGQRGFLGVGRADWCPNCGGRDRSIADDQGVRICSQCNAVYARDNDGRLGVGPAQKQSPRQRADEGS